MSRTIIKDGAPVEISDADYAVQFPTVSLPPPAVSGDAIIGAISDADAAKCRPRDLMRIAWRDDVPATNAKLKRMADVLGTTPDALRQAATA